MRLSKISEDLAPHLLLIFNYISISLILATAMPTHTSIMAGAVISSVGLLLGIWSLGYRDNRREFQVYGPYKYVRFPVHLSIFFMFFGGCIAGRSGLATTVILICTLVLFKTLFKREEVIYAKAGGTKYMSYKIQVSSFLPNLIPFSQDGETSQSFFSFKRAMVQNRGGYFLFCALVGYLVLFLIMTFSQVQPYQLLIAFVFALILTFRFFQIVKRQKLNKGKRTI